MSRKANRRDPRVAVALDVRLQTAAEDVSYETKDISYRGVFIVCDSPFPLRRLARFQAVLTNGETLQMMGLVAHRISEVDAAERGMSPGMGLQLYSLGAQTRQQWRDHIDQLIEQDSEVIEAIEEQNIPRLRLHIPDEAALEQFVSVDLPHGSFFYRTPEPQPTGTVVVCEVVHPTTFETFEIPAMITESFIEGGRRNRGMTLTLNSMDAEKRADFDGFMSALGDELSIPE